MSGPSILFLTSGRRIPSSRFRVQQYIPRLRADGFRIRVAPCIPNKHLTHFDFPIGGRPLALLLNAAKFQSRLLSVLRSPFHDLVFIERELLPRRTNALEHLAAGLNRHIQFDFDDALHLKYGNPANNPVAEILRLVRGVSAGNDWLAAYARQYNPNVHVVPTAIDTARFTPGPPGDVPLVWTGSGDNLPFLEALAPALRRVPQARILVICNRPPGDLGIPVEYIPWSEESEVTALRRGRIGLMPLPDTEWAKGKCGFKLLQYMSCGIPCVASPVGVNAGILAGGESGLLATSEDEWVEALQRLSVDRALADRLGREGRRRAEEFYSIDAVYPRLRSALISTLQWIG